jgi:hypothetical protein
MVSKLSMCGCLAARGEFRMISDRLRQGTVQPRAFPRQEVAVDGLLDQYVPECIRVVFEVRKKDLMINGFPECGDQVLIGDSRNAGQELIGDAPAGCGRDAQDGPCRFR